jgi:hypothetical protein
MFRNFKNVTQLSMETLEPRWLMAGNVTAYLAPDDWGSESVLVVEGDSQSNAIRIVEDTPGQARIEGLDGTTVNGMAADEVFSALETFSLAIVDLGNGHDSLTYECGGEFAGSPFHATKIYTGTGADTVTVFAKEMTGFTAIDTGPGNDTVTFDMAAGSLIGTLHLKTGKGDDSVLVRADPEGEPPVFCGTFATIETEHGNDTVRFEGAIGVVPIRLSVLLGAGDDTLIGDSGSDPSWPLRVNANGGDGEDSVLNSSYFDSLYSLYGFESIDGE